MSLEMISHTPRASARAVPILFVHGAWHGAWCWAEPFLPYFADHGYAAYALSLRGHGKSEGRERLRWTRIADYVADVEQVAARLPRPPIVVGHSMGGLVVQKYLETHVAPAGVLLAAVPVGGIWRTTLRIAGRHPRLFLKANVTMSLYPLVSTPSLAREVFFSADMPAEQVGGYSASLGDESYLAFMDMLVFNLPKPQKVKSPMLVLGAEQDAIFSPGEIQATARAYHTQAEIFPGMAHDMMLEAGWRAVADRILDWLKEKGL